jgi:hypothetical protein
MNMRRLSILLLLSLGIAGCSRQDYPGAKRYPLSGKVTIDGQPLDWGSISFIPPSGEQRVSGDLIKDGAYSVPEEKGANSGKYKVEIRWNRKTGRKVRDNDSGEMYDERKEGLPPRYHANSELSAEVSARQSTFDFDLKSN